MFLQTSGGQTRRVLLQTPGGQTRHASSYKLLEGKQDMRPPTNLWRSNKTRILQTSGGQTRHASSYKPLEVKQDMRPPTNLWGSNKTRVLLQTSGGQTRHASSYKPLEVMTNRTSFLCRNRNGHHNTKLNVQTHNRTTIRAIIYAPSLRQVYI
jgi:ribosomal protein L34E